MDCSFDRQAPTEPWASRRPRPEEEPYALQKPAQQQSWVFLGSQVQGRTNHKDPQVKGTEAFRVVVQTAPSPPPGLCLRSPLLWVVWAAGLHTPKPEGDPRVAMCTLQKQLLAWVDLRHRGWGIKCVCKISLPVGGGARLGRERSKQQLGIRLRCRPTQLCHIPMQNPEGSEGPGCPPGFPSFYKLHLSK